MNETNTDLELLTLLHELHEKMYPMMEFCERLQPVKLETNDNNQTTTVDLTDEEEMMITKLFRLDDEMVNEDQTGRSILKDLRRVIGSLEK